MIRMLRFIDWAQRKVINVIGIPSFSDNQFCSEIAFIDFARDIFENILLWFDVAYLCYTKLNRLYVLLYVRVPMTYVIKYTYKYI